MTVKLRRVCGEHFASKIKDRRVLVDRLSLRSESLPNGPICGTKKFRKGDLSDRSQSLLRRIFERVTQPIANIEVCITRKPSCQFLTEKTSLELCALFNHFSFSKPELHSSNPLKREFDSRLNAALLSPSSEYAFYYTPRLDRDSDPDRGPPQLNLNETNCDRDVFENNSVDVLIGRTQFQKMMWRQVVAAIATIRRHLFCSHFLRAEVLHV